MPDPDLINSQQHGWNEPGELFNEDQPTPKVFRYLRARPENIDASPYPSQEERAKKTTFVDPDVNERIKVTDDAPVQRTALVGNYAAVRAAQVAHQHRVGFWDSEGVVGFIGRASAPNPSDDQLDQMWEDLQLFSYLPPELMPSEDQFKQYAKPQDRVGVIRNNLGNLGLRDSSPNTADLDDRNGSLDNEPLIPPPPAFSEFGLSFCQRELERVLGIS